jgi:peptidoglycan/LPS O-acetylase OafA/YrhL
VVLVVAFHAGVGRLAGGYVGVDVFFVLSGFLITGILLRDALGGRLSLVDFYARRARRLLPVALIVLVGVSVVWVAVAGAVERATLGADARSAALYFSNWHFAAQATDYFASADEPSPFLHFWSLSVEEQFYVGWPLVVLVLCSVGAAARARRRVGLVAAALMVGSLAALAIHTANGAEARAYFGTDGRVYQLLAGALLAVWAVGRSAPAPRRTRLAGQVAGLLGLGGIVVVAAVGLGIGPSLRGVLATAGAVLVLAGLEVARRGPAGRLLSLGWAAYLGRASYGIYLFHWPVTLIVRRFVEMPPKALFAVVLVVSTGLAALTLQLVETPIRHSAWLAPRRRLVVASGLALGLVVGMAVTPALLDSDRRPVVVAAAAGRPSAAAARPEASTGTPVPPLAQVKAAAKVHRPGNPCLGGVTLFDRGCVINRGTKGTVFVLGDSHLEAWIGPLAQLAKERDVTMHAWISYLCPWQRDVYPTGAKSGCPKRKPAVYAEVAKVRPDTVIVLNRGYDDPNYSRPLFHLGAPDDTDPGRALAAGTPEAVDHVLGLAGRLVVVQPWPAMVTNQRSCLATARFVESCEGRSAGALRSEGAVDEAAGRDSRVGVVDLDQLVCPRLPVCDAVLDGIVTHRDQDHVSLAFAEVLTARFGALLDRAGAFPGA